MIGTGLATRRFMTSLELTLKIARASSDVSAEEWDACANPGVAAAAHPACAALETAAPTSTIEYNPFISHDFLACLELSKSVQPRTGWEPLLLLAQEPDGRLAGAMPCYAKSHSRGEYVFDHGWA
jgi:predicted N-acyltransferase